MTARRRYNVMIADRTTGKVRRTTISLRPALSTMVAILVVPILMGLGAHWSAEREIDTLRDANDQLEAENSNYREATGELTDVRLVANQRDPRPAPVLPEIGQQVGVLTVGRQRFHHHD